MSDLNSDVVYHEYDTNMDGIVSEAEYNAGFDLVIWSEIIRILYVSLQAALGIYFAIKGFRSYRGI
jgi:hypothetical protein